MKKHNATRQRVLLNYKITRLSNAKNKVTKCRLVLLNYKITRLSNGACANAFIMRVLLNYKITRLSNIHKA